MCGFTEIELVRLTRLRDRYRAREWPPTTDGASLVERHGIVMAAIPLGIAEGGVVRYRCVLERPGREGVSPLEALFQVMPTYPAPPEADEVLRWLAACVANSVISHDLSAWGLACGIAATGRVRGLPYRGLVHDEPDLGAFALAQHRRANALRAFLGPRGFAELMQEVGIG